jgi:hypothetical protein
VTADLREIVQDYTTRFRRRAELELEYYRGLPTIEEAITEAAMARFRGRKLSHQYRISNDLLAQSRNRLMTNIDAVRSCKTFDDLFDLVEHLSGSIPGIGELAVYDTALRIGVHLGLTPERIYLHAGTRKGARRLGLDVAGPTLEVTGVPEELQALTPREIEDVLCIYKDAFANPVEVAISARGCRPNAAPEAIASSC